MSFRWISIFIGLSLFSISFSQVYASDKVVIAHRGASGYLPEHTLPSKAMAYAFGVDYLEQDIVMTKDNKLIILHDHYLDRVTDVADKFPSKARKDGRYYAIDFTLKEIRTLQFTEEFTIENGKKVQLRPLRFPMFKSSFHIHTLEEELELIQGLNHSTKNNIGIYPEIKVPWFHKQEGKDISKAVLEVLKKYGYKTRKDKVYLQCFDPNELLRIKKELMPTMGIDLKLVQLIAFTDWEETFEKDANGQLKNYSYDWMFEKGAMKKISAYADGIGPQYLMLIDKKSKKGKVIFTDMLHEAKINKLEIHPYTLRVENIPDYADNINEMFRILFIDAGVGGLFTDFPDLAVDFLKNNKKHK